MPHRRGAVPPTLHQMWFDAQTLDTATAPPKYRRYVRSFRRLNPRWRYEWWDRRRVESMWRTEPRLRPWRDFFFHRIAKNIERCDFSRYALLWLKGGLYVDLDYECLRPVDALVEGREFGWAQEPAAHTRSSDRVERRMLNAVLFSRPAHPVWPDLMSYIARHYDPNSLVSHTTGYVRVALFCQERGWSPATRPDLFIRTSLVHPDGRPYRTPVAPDAFMTTRGVDGTHWLWRPDNWPPRLRHLVFLVTLATFGVCGCWPAAVSTLLAQSAAAARSASPRGSIEVKSSSR